MSFALEASGADGNRYPVGVGSAYNSELEQARVLAVRVGDLELVGGEWTEITIHRRAWPLHRLPVGGSEEDTQARVAQRCYHIDHVVALVWVALTHGSAGDGDDGEDEEDQLHLGRGHASSPMDRYLRSRYEYGGLASYSPAIYLLDVLFCPC